MYAPKYKVPEKPHGFRNTPASKFGFNLSLAVTIVLSSIVLLVGTGIKKLRGPDSYTSPSIFEEDNMFTFHANVPLLGHAITELRRRERERYMNELRKEVLAEKNKEK